MNRRNILKLASTSLFLGCISNISAARGINLSGGKGLDVRFTDGVKSFALPDGSWNLWVRAAPRGFQERFVRLRLQVAEDEGFNIIIAEQTHNCAKDFSYILRTNFATKKEVPELFFRFVALDSGLPDRRNEVISSPVGKLKSYSDVN
jgi:phosphodiesterase/alkaline phosphatase D-like protein